MTRDQVEKLLDLAMIGIEKRVAQLQQQQQSQSSIPAPSRVDHEGKPQQQLQSPPPQLKTVKNVKPLDEQGGGGGGSSLHNRKSTLQQLQAHVQRSYGSGA